MNQAEMIPCDQVIARLWEYLDGELDPERSAPIQAHLEMCARCFPQYEFQRAYKTFVRRSAQQEIPPALRRRIFEVILAEESGRPLENGLRPSWFDRLRERLTRLGRGS
jgi:mycothiol system anti-sigma-R factor